MPVTLPRSDLLYVLKNIKKLYVYKIKKCVRVKSVSTIDILVIFDDYQMDLTLRKEHGWKFIIINNLTKIDYVPTNDFDPLYIYDIFNPSEYELFEWDQPNKEDINKLIDKINLVYTNKKISKLLSKKIQRYEKCVNIWTKLKKDHNLPYDIMKHQKYEYIYATEKREPDENSKLLTGKALNDYHNIKDIVIQNKTLPSQFHISYSYNGCNEHRQIIFKSFNGSSYDNIMNEIKNNTEKIIELSKLSIIEIDPDTVSSSYIFKTSSGFIKICYTDDDSTCGGHAIFVNIDHVKHIIDFDGKDKSISWWLTDKYLCDHNFGEINKELICLENMTFGQ
jgi:hypothetical protein